jgi:hypothetical protein
LLCLSLFLSLRAPSIFVREFIAKLNVGMTQKASFREDDFTGLAVSNFQATLVCELNGV